MSPIEMLPELCYGSKPAMDGGPDILILIRRGESGYHPAEGYAARSEELADLFNARLGVTPAERAAMEFGSMFGWDIPGADPNKHVDRVAVKPADGETRTDYLERVKAATLEAFRAATPARVD